MRGGVGEDNFQRRPDLAIEKMPAARRAVRQAKNDMNVEACLAIVADGDIPNCTQDFALFGNLDFSIGLLFEIEPADRGSFERPDRRQGSRGNRGLVREFSQRRKCLFAGIENDDASLQPGVVSNFRALHGRHHLRWTFRVKQLAATGIVPRRSPYTKAPGKPRASIHRGLHPPAVIRYPSAASRARRSAFNRSKFARKASSDFFRSLSAFSASQRLFSFFAKRSSAVRTGFSRFSKSMQLQCLKALKVPFLPIADTSNPRPQACSRHPYWLPP